MTIEFVHGSHDAVLEFLFGFDADVAQHRAGELREEAFDEIEPGSTQQSQICQSDVPTVVGGIVGNNARKRTRS